MVSVHRHKCLTWQEAVAFTQQKVQEGCGNVRLITSQSKLAKRYNIQEGEIQVRYW